MRIRISSILQVAFIGVVSTASAQNDHAGKALFVKAKCDSCHSVESQGVATKREGDEKAVDLSNAGATITNAEWAKKYVLREESKDGKKHRRPYKGPDKDLDTIIEWLMTLKTS